MFICHNSTLFRPISPGHNVDIVTTNTRRATVDEPSLSSARVASAAFATTIGSVIPVFLMGGLAVQIIGELNMSATQLGLVVSLYFAVSGITSIACGRAIERFGILAGAYLGIGISAASMVAIAGLAHSVLWLAIFMVIAAPANGLGQLSANAILATYGPRHRKGLLFGLKQATIPLSTMLAGISVPVIALTVGWRWAFVASAVVALAAIPQLWPIPDKRNGQQRGARSAPKTKIGSPALVVMTVATLAAATAATPTGSFLADYATHVGISPGLAGLNLTLGGLFGVVARTFVGWVADRNGGVDPLLMMTGLLAVGATGLALFTADLHWIIPLATILSFGFGWSWPGLLNFAIAGRYPSAPAAATGVTQTGVYLGGSLGPLGFGLLVDHSGYSAAWWAVAICMIVAAVLVEIGRRMLNQQAQP